MKILVTGGAGFIGCNLVHFLVKEKNAEVLNIDKLTYAANTDALKDLEGNESYGFIKADINDRKAIREALKDFQPDAVMHLAAESHVDRSIEGADDFIQTNINGTYVLLVEALSYWEEQGKPDNFRFIHISTDEVYGSLDEKDEAFTESTAYAPNSPYSASKAASDHLVRAWNKTYDLPTIITHCSNNYGPYQHLEKLIPLTINNCLNNKQLPVYGDGKNIRDWIYVLDHISALWAILNDGAVGETYNIGGENEFKNIDIVKKICTNLDQTSPKEDGTSYEKLISFVKDRLGHDFRYAIDNSKINSELGWSPSVSFDKGLEKTISWYKDKEIA